MPVTDDRHYDVIIVGTGAGGGTLVHRLASTGKRVLLLERGDYLPHERDNWDSTAVSASLYLFPYASLMASASKVSAGQEPAAPVFDSYGWLSRNPTTRELEKIETQHGDNEKTIARHGGTVGERLDDGLSAWKLGVRRKGFETLLERASAGVSQGIAVWHVDRRFWQPPLPVTAWTTKPIGQDLQDTA